MKDFKFFLFNSEQKIYILLIFCLFFYKQVNLIIKTGKALSVSNVKSKVLFIKKFNPLFFKHRKKESFKIFFIYFIKIEFHESNLNEHYRINFSFREFLIAKFTSSYVVAGAYRLLNEFTRIIDV
jgi:hypothetical protein